MYQQQKICDDGLPEIYSLKELCAMDESPCGQKTGELTIDDILRLQPALDAVLTVARCRPRGLDVCRTYSLCKELALPLVGWHAADERLRTSQAYEVFIDALCDVLHI